MGGPVSWVHPTVLRDRIAITRDPAEGCCTGVSPEVVRSESNRLGHVSKVQEGSKLIRFPLALPSFQSLTPHRDRTRKHQIFCGAEL